MEAKIPGFETKHLGQYLFDRVTHSRLQRSKSIARSVSLLWYVDVDQVTEQRIKANNLGNDGDMHNIW